MTEEWLTTQEAAELSGLSRSHIGYLLRNGKLQGKKMGRDWVTSRTALEAYLASDPHPGPKTKNRTTKNT